jgi:hypothetical protein
VSQKEPEIQTEVLRKIDEVWKAFPDLRLGQLLMCAVGADSTNQVFYCEDSEMIRKLDVFNKRKGDQ